MKYPRITGVATLLFSLLILSTPTWALPIAEIDFGILPNNGGAVDYAGGANPLIGTNIGVANVEGINTPLDSGNMHNLVNGELNFTSGAFTGLSGSNLTFGPGGSLTITGAIPDLGISLTTLVSGMFNNMELVPVGSLFQVVVGGFNDTKNPALLADVGFSLIDLLTGGLNLQVAGDLNADGFHASLVDSGDVTDTQAVAEPASLLLLGAGLVGLWWLNKREFRITLRPNLPA